jgi:hypothetical protein
MTKQKMTKARVASIAAMPKSADPEKLYDLSDVPPEWLGAVQPQIVNGMSAERISEICRRYVDKKSD